MEPGVIVTGLLLLSAFVVPVIWLYISQRKKRNEFIKAFIQAIEPWKVNKDTSDVWDNAYGVGIDLDSRVLLYWRKNEQLNNPFVIPLAEIESCEVVKVGEGIFIEHIDLILTCKKPKGVSKRLEFFDSKGTNNGHSDELTLTREWKQRIDEAIKSGRV